MDLGFPLGIRLTHAFNLVFLTLLIRSGIEILGGHPMLYFNEHCRPGSEWIRFTSKRMFRNLRWTAEDEKQPYTPWVALPGRDNLGLGRFWHFVAVIGWVFTGLIYVLVLFTGEQWRRLVPTSPSVFPEAWIAAVAYLRFDVPPAGHPYNALQQLTYFAVVFVLTPLQIATGLAMSPALSGRFTWIPRLFGGRQAARSLHFIGLIAFVGFVIHHVALVVAHGLLDGLAAILLGVEAPTPEQRAIAVAIALVFLVALIALHVWATRRSLQEPRAVQDALQRIVDPLQSRVLQPLTSRQRYQPQDITQNPRPNGRPPCNQEYVDLLERGFADWRFEVGGLVIILSRSPSPSCEALRQSTRSLSTSASRGGATRRPGRACRCACYSTAANQSQRLATFSFVLSMKSGKSQAMGSTTASSISISPVHLKRCSRTT